MRFRFGRGIYTTSCSSSKCSPIILLSIIADLYTEADDYSSNLHQDGAAKVVVLSRVVVGKAMKKKGNQTNRTGVDPPFHSVSRLRVKPACLALADQ
jgi:hypothetical protein